MLSSFTIHVLVTIHVYEHYSLIRVLITCTGIQTHTYSCDITSLALLDTHWRVSNSLFVRLGLNSSFKLKKIQHLLFGLLQQPSKSCLPPLHYLHEIINTTCGLYIFTPGSRRWDNDGGNRPHKKPYSQGQSSRLPLGRGGGRRAQHSQQRRSTWRHWPSFEPMNYNYCGIYGKHARECWKKARDFMSVTQLQQQLGQYGHG